LLSSLSLSLSHTRLWCLRAHYRAAKRLLTDRDAGLRERLLQVLFKQGKFQWSRLENLIKLARESGGGLDLTDTVGGIPCTSAASYQLTPIALESSAWPGLVTQP
jgi:hypothetical protein